MTRDFVTDLHENLRTTATRMAKHVPEGETSQFGSTTVASAGVPIPVFNRVLVFETPGRENLEAAMTWLTEREVPFWVTVAGPVVDDVRALGGELDLQPIDDEPGMVLSSLDEIPPNETDAEISKVTDASGLKDFVTVFAEVFELPLEIVDEVTPSSILTDDTIDVFVGRMDGQAVACGQLVQSGDVAGVYTIGVIEEFRHRGIGEATTWAVLRTGREAGCEVGVLQSSEMAYSLYEGMGFEPVVDYHHFELSA